MTYIAICIGTILGYILRFVYYLRKKNKKIKNGKKHFFWLSGIKATALKICQNNVFRMISYVALYFIDCIESWGQKQIKQLMSNDYIYIIAKVAQVYSQKNNRISIIKISSVKEYCEKFKEKYIVVEAEQKRPVCKPEYFEKSEQQVEWYCSPEIYIAELHNVCISGASSIIEAQQEGLYDTIAYDKEKRLDVKFSNVIGAIGEDYIVGSRKTARNAVEGIFLLGFASYNYYHMTVEITSRLKYIDNFEEYRHLPIFVDEIMIQIPQYSQLLSRCNFYNHEIIGVKSGEVVQIGRLIYPSYNTWMPINVRSRGLIQARDFMVAKSALENIRTYIRLPATNKTENIFISRKNIASTRLKNEDRVRALFERYGFKIIYTEELSYEEQVNLFHSARCVVGTSGAALTNIIYCQEGTDIICIIPEEYRFYMYSTIAYLLNLNPVFLDAEVVYRTAYTASDLFEVNLGYCERFLEQYIF